MYNSLQIIKQCPILWSPECSSEVHFSLAVCSQVVSPPMIIPAYTVSNLESPMEPFKL